MGIISSFQADSSQWIIFDSIETMLLLPIVTGFSESKKIRINAIANIL